MPPVSEPGVGGDAWYHQLQSTKLVLDPLVPRGGGRTRPQTSIGAYHLSPQLPVHYKPIYNAAAGQCLLLHVYMENVSLGG